MKSIWESYPPDYRAAEVHSILSAVQAGECVSLVGLSGSGKSNLLGFMANRNTGQPSQMTGMPAFVLVDCNRAQEFTLQALFWLILDALQDGETPAAGAELADVEAAIGRRLAAGGGLCLLLDRFDAFTHPELDEKIRLSLASNLRALRDAHKYALTFAVATRHPLDPHTELAELFYANTIWLGPLNEQDTRWNIERYARRRNLSWGEETIQMIWRFSGGYPSILRAACEAVAGQASAVASQANGSAAGAILDEHRLAQHPAVRRRLEEFFADQPTPEELRLSGLAQLPVFRLGRPPSEFDTARLTAKELLLWTYFLAHPDQVCEKDDLIRAVWPEDRIFERGVRDDSLAQLIRRLREKVEPDASAPSYIHTLPGRGYRFTPEKEVYPDEV